MRKKVFGRKLGRDRGSRKALFRSLVRALVLNGEIETTRAKAKAIQPDIDKIMSWAGKDPLMAKRIVMSKLGNDKETTNKLFAEFSGVARNRKSGFTRLTALPARKGDNSPMVRLEWVELPKKEVKKVKK